jgi:cysteine synthase B
LSVSTTSHPLEIRSRLESGLLSQVGNTPLLGLSRLGAVLSPGVEIRAKVEWLNPAGSVKDRPAASILRAALLSGDLSPDKTLLDSTSGNMGTAYAAFGAALGLRVHLAVPANIGPRRLAILRALGAEVTLTDPLEGSDGARVVAAELAGADPGRFYYADQYSNPANWRAHYEGTGPEILEQTGGRVTHFVAALGTTGTLVGVARFLKERAPDVRIIAVQPDGPMHGLEGLKHLPSSDVPPIYDPTIPDEVIAVRTEDAYEMARRLAREEGLLVSASAGAAAWAAVRVAERLDRGMVVTVFPDSGLKYLDDPLWTAR